MCTCMTIEFTARFLGRDRLTRRVSPNIAEEVSARRVKALLAQRDVHIIGYL